MIFNLNLIMNLSLFNFDHSKGFLDKNLNFVAASTIN